MIQFGYTLNKNGFDLNNNIDQEIVFAVPASLSDRTKKLTVLFIQDKTVTWEKNDLVINNTSWDQFIIGLERLMSALGLIGNPKMRMSGWK